MAAAAGTDCKVFASIYSYLNSDRLSEAPIAMVRAAAANAWAAGVDGLYINQWFYNVSVSTPQNERFACDANACSSEPN